MVARADSGGRRFIPFPPPLLPPPTPHMPPSAPLSTLQLCDGLRVGERWFMGLWSPNVRDEEIVQVRQVVLCTLVSRPHTLNTLAVQCLLSRRLTRACSCVHTHCLVPPVRQPSGGRCAAPLVVPAPSPHPLSSLFHFGPWTQEFVKIYKDTLALPPTTPPAALRPLCQCVGRHVR